ncbi:MAG: CRTAC1 family protein [Chloroflexi bacterium]|nr:MAG: CRTAC1 family protein [Chloroflexota bacterium]
MPDSDIGKMLQALPGLLLVLGALAALMLASSTLASRGAQPQKLSPTIHLEPEPLPLDTFRIFDLGVADFNDDGYLDIFTSNHSARQSFLPGDGAGTFGPNRLLDWGLSQSPIFPGLEDTGRPPQMMRSGLYIYWQGSRLYLRTKGGDAATAWEGALTFLTPIEWESDDVFAVSVQEVVLSEDARGARLYFRADGGGTLTVEPQPAPRVGSPITVTLASTVSLSTVFVGSERVPPPGRQFVLALKDRHGLVWGDFDGDARTDLFISRGANLGLTDFLTEAFMSDELFLGRAEGFARADASAWGFAKKACAARQTGLTDVNGDGRPDIYIVCARKTPNQLWLREDAGRFREEAGQYGLGFPEVGSFAWLDVDGDLRSDMFWAGEQGFRLCFNRGDAFACQSLKAPKRWVRNLAVGDFDGDGDGDVFAASADGNLLFVNEEGVFAVEQANRRGLPDKALAANWVDIDNDGLLDLFAVPGGVYRQVARDRFRFVWRPSAPVDGQELDQARSSWFDADGDGAMDLVLATRPAGADRWQAGYYLNRSKLSNHWLQIRLRGPQANREAIGTRVEVSTQGGRQAQEVGWWEGSHYSQGHYRLYFGLGQATVADVRVFWPDGKTKTLPGVGADRVLTVSYP